MRRLRLSVGGTVILALLGGLGGAAVAEDADPRVSAVVTGTESCTIAQMGTKSVADEDGFFRFRDHLTDCVFEASDARLDGVWRNTFNEDCYPVPDGDEAACVIWGTSVLEGETGGWDCSYVGHDEGWHARAALVIAACPGTGAYSGLTLVLRHVFDGTPLFADGTDMHGVIYEGPSPPWGPIPEPPAQ